MTDVIFLRFINRTEASKRRAGSASQVRGEERVTCARLAFASVRLKAQKKLFPVLLATPEKGIK